MKDLLLFRVFSIQLTGGIQSFSIEICTNIVIFSLNFIVNTQTIAWIAIKIAYILYTTFLSTPQRNTTQK